MTWVDERSPAEVTATLSKLGALPADSGLGRTWADHLAYTGGDERFALFMVYVDRRVRRTLGVSVYDMADWEFRGAYDSGLSPRETTISFAEDNRDEFGYGF